MTRRRTGVGGGGSAAAMAGLLDSPEADGPPEGLPRPTLQVKGVKALGMLGVGCVLFVVYPPEWSVAAPACVAQLTLHLFKPNSASGGRASPNRCPGLAGSNWCASPQPSSSTEYNKQRS